MKKLIATKTFWSGLALVGYGVFQIVNGQMQEGIQSILGGASVIFIRDAIRKTDKNSSGYHL